VRGRAGPRLDARFVLCRPRNPQNLGAAARALKCAGVPAWALVDPQTLDFDAARPLAVHAEDLLATPRIVRTLDEALEGCVLSVGTTARPRPERPLLSPREAAERLAAARGPVAVVFGDERSGLTADEVERVDLLSAIPSAPEQPSWNLAQAVAIYAHELRAAVPFGETAPATSSATADPGAFAAMDRALAEALEAIGKPGARRRLARSIERAQLTGREATLWTAMWRAMARAARK
jgi:TrmH family RNA methyltransferase